MVGSFHNKSNITYQCRLNLSASAAGPNPQGSFPYRTIPISKSLLLTSSTSVINPRQRFAVNGVSFVIPDTPLKLADNYNIANVFTWDSLPLTPTARPAVLGTPVVRVNLNEFVEIIFQNSETSIQSWHLDGYAFWVVGYEPFLTDKLFDYRL